jgi:hypothetical protein
VYFNPDSVVTSLAWVLRLAITYATAEAATARIKIMTMTLVLRPLPDVGRATTAEEAVVRVRFLALVTLR